MSIYQDRILPHAIHWTMRQPAFAPYRNRVASAADGRVLEIGIGSGLNLRSYPAAVEQIIGLDPSPRLLALAHDAALRIPIPVELIQAGAEAIPLSDRSVDTILTTWTLCSIADIRQALAEMRRVLRPGGRLLFVEHGRAPQPAVQWWQDRLTPLWKRLGGGCHLNRDMSDLIAGAGFRIERLETGYMPGPKPMTFMYEGSARPS
jgi:ubiquinone/menaquinone biosynthesis C-methylase UbiE